MRHLLLLIIAIGLVSCATRQVVSQTDGSADSKQTVMDPTTQANMDVAHESFLQALHLKAQGREMLALPWLQNAAEHAPNSRFLAFEVVRELMDLNRNAEALEYAARTMRKISDPTAEELFLLAHLYRQGGQIDSCKNYFQKTIAKQPDHFRALYEYSVVLELLQDYQQLEGVYAKMLPLLSYPDQLVGKYIEILKRRDKGGDSVAISMLFDRLNYSPSLENAEPLFNGLVQMDSLRLARNVLELVEQQSQGDLAKLQFLRTSWERLQDVPGALRVQAGIFQLDTTSATELKKLIELRVRMGQMDSVQQDMQAYLKLDTSSVGDHLHGILLEQMGKREESLAAFDRAIAKAPKRWVHYEAKYETQVRARLWEEAHKTLDAALGVFVDMPAPLLAKGNVYFSQGLQIRFEDSLMAQKLYAQALPWVEKAYLLDTNRQDPLFTYAALHERLDQVDRAKALFERLLRLEPNNARALNTYGYMLIYRMIDPALGLKLVDQALLLQANNPAYLDSKAWGLAMMGKWEDARALFLQIMTLPGSEDEEIFDHAAEVERKLGNEAKAIEYWKKALELYPAFRKVQNILKKSAESGK